MNEEKKKHKPSKCPYRIGNGTFGCTTCMPISNSQD